MRLRVRNFRLLRDVEITFDEEVPTVFIGPNGSGKSTVLEALDFLGRCSTEGLQAAAVAHGGIQNIRTIGAAGPVSLELTWALRMDSGKPQEQDHELRWAVSLQPESSGAVTVLREELTDTVGGESRALVSTDERGLRSVLTENDTAVRPSRVSARNKLAFEELADPERFAGLDLLRVMLGTTNVIGAISTAPQWARSDRTAESPRDSLVIAPRSFLDRQGLGLEHRSG